jgi:hypothetical protein
LHCARVNLQYLRHLIVSFEGARVSVLLVLIESTKSLPCHDTTTYYE